MQLLPSSAPLFALVALSPTPSAQCPDLDLRFRAPRADGIPALAVFDAGSGAELVAASTNLGLTAWDGEHWRKLDAGLDGVVHTFLVHDFGSGPELVVGGSFLHAGGVAVNRIARFDGATWSALGVGFDGVVQALATYDGGSGPRLCATGSFAMSGVTPVASIAMFDGNAWIPLAGGLDGPGHALAAFDAGSGPELAVGGEFLHAGGVASSGVARWNGTSWSSLAGGVDGEVRSLLALGVPGAHRLVVGGSFQDAGGVAASLIASFDGVAWSALGPGLDSTPVFGGTVDALLADGVGFVAAGRFETFAAPGNVSTNVARWDGSAWQALDSGLGVPLYVGVDALARFDPADGGGARTFAGGSFLPQTGQPSSIAQWDGADWSALLDVEAQGLIHDPSQNGATSATTWQGELVIAGEFEGAGSAPSARGVARWDGGRWRTLGTFPVFSYLDHPTLVRRVDLGAGPELVLGMLRHTSPDSPVPLYRWSGADWLPFEHGVPPPGTFADVLDVEVFDAGSGPQLFACGYGFHPGGSPAAESIARWNGSAWTSFGGGGAPSIDDYVYCLEVFDDGSGPALYAGGRMPGAILRWDGNGWNVVGSGLTNAPDGNAFVSDLAVFDHGAGAQLYACGNFGSAGGGGLRGIARWNGTAWGAPPGIDPNFPGAFDVEVFGDASGAGPRLYTMDLVDDLWSFDGSAWTRMGFTEPYFTGTRITALADLPGGSGLVLHGNFREAFEVGQNPEELPGLTILRACPRITSFCAGDGGASVDCPCGNDGTIGRGCQNSAGTGGALLSASGTPSLGADTLVLTAIGERPTALSIFLQGSVEIAPTIYGDGLRCTGGVLKRLYTRNAVGGAVTAPVGGDPSVSARSAALGHVIPLEGTRLYQVYYRDPIASFCPSPPGGTFNVSNGLRIVWGP